MIEIHLKCSLIKVICCTEDLPFCQSEDLGCKWMEILIWILDFRVLVISVAHIHFLSR